MGIRMRLGLRSALGTAVIIGVLALSAASVLGDVPVRASTAAPVSLLPTQPLSVSAAAPLATHRAARIDYKDQSISVAAPADCAAVKSSSFYAEFCRDLTVGDWSSIAVPTSQVGPTPAMLARLVRAAIDRDESVCADAATIRYVQMGSRSTTTAAEATAMCVSSLRSFAQTGATILDYTSTDNSSPLMVPAQ
jgi:hypothetical protein